MTDPPTIRDLITAFTSAIRAEKDENADKIQGSLYEIVGGASAILFSQQAQRDTDLFDDVLFDTATGRALANRTIITDNIPPILDSYGTGVATWVRSVTTPDTIYAGTRILVAGGSSSSPAIFYEVTADVFSTTTTATTPIRASLVGTGVAISSTACTLLDPLATTWNVTSVTCADGTDYEGAPAYRARVRALRIADRVGFPDTIIAALETIGATEVIPFSGSYISNTYPISVLYVGDSGFSTSPALITQCMLALDSIAPLGGGIQVRPMQNVTIGFDITLTLNVGAAQVNTISITQGVIATVGQYMATDAGRYAYNLQSIKAAVLASSPYIKSAVINTPVASAVGVVVSSNFVPVMNRYTVDTRNFNIHYS